MFEQAFRGIDGVLRREAGCTTELDYTEQTSWLLFVQSLDSLEADKADEAQLEGKRYADILDKPYRWETWAAPKGRDGARDHNAALTGDNLRDFANAKLFPYLQNFTRRASGPTGLTPSDGSPNRCIYYQTLAETLQRKVIHAFSQATLPIINKSKWSAISIWLPPKVAPQKKIAAKFDELVEETRRLPRLDERKVAAREALKKSQPHQAFTEAV